MSPRQWELSGAYSRTWVCFYIYLSTIYFIWHMARYKMRLTCVPPNVTRSTKLRGAQCSPELAFKNKDFCIPENLIFPAWVWNETSRRGHFVSILWDCWCLLNISFFFVQLQHGFLNNVATHNTWHWRLSFMFILKFHIINISNSPYKHLFYWLHINIVNFSRVKVVQNHL